MPFPPLKKTTVAFGVGFGVFSCGKKYLPHNILNFKKICRKRLKMFAHSCYNPNTLYLDKENCVLDLQNSKNSIQMDSKIQKLVILFVFEKMAIPLTEATVLDVCSSENDWLTYMECKQYLSELIDTNLVYRVPKSDCLNITQDGISCLALFFTRIPSSIRDQITAYARDNRMRFKKRQSYFCDYSKNADGTYTVIMKINNESTTLMELKLVVANRSLAKFLYKSWVDKASQTYALIHDTLLD
jgi:hypothetical protein